MSHCYNIALCMNVATMYMQCSVLTGILFLIFFSLLNNYFQNILMIFQLSLLLYVVFLHLYVSCPWVNGLGQFHHPCYNANIETVSNIIISCFRYNLTTGSHRVSRCWSNMVESHVLFAPGRPWLWHFKLYWYWSIVWNNGRLRSTS